MHVQFQGRPWELDLSDISLKQAMVIQGYTGMSINKWVESLNDEAGADGTITRAAAESPDFLKSLAAVFWLMKNQNGEHYPIGDSDFMVGAFTQAVAEAFAAEQAEQAAKAGPEPDPTPLPPDWPLSPEPASTPTPQPSVTPEPAGFPDG